MMKTIVRVADEYAKFARWVAVISGVVVMLIMVYTTIDVTGRYLFNHPVPAAYELTNIFLIYITYFGVTLVQSRGGHMRLGFLYEKVGIRGKAIIDLGSAIIGLFVVGIITWQGWIYAVEAWKVGEVTLGAYTVPVFPGRIALAVGATIFILQYIIDTIKNIFILIDPKSIIPSATQTVEPNSGVSSEKAGA